MLLEVQKTPCITRAVKDYLGYFFINGSALYWDRTVQVRSYMYMYIHISKNIDFYRRRVGDNSDPVAVICLQGQSYFYPIPLRQPPSAFHIELVLMAFGRPYKQRRSHLIRVRGVAMGTQHARELDTTRFIVRGGALLLLSIMTVTNKLAMEVITATTRIIDDIYHTVSRTTRIFI